MILFFDSSAMIKRYIVEDGSPQVAVIGTSSNILVSPLTWSEVHATFARRLLDGLLDRPKYQELCEGFRTDWRYFGHVAPGSGVLRRIPRITELYRLKGADALQCASALAIGGIEPMLFVCSDRRLKAAAAAEGLTVWDPAETEAPGS